MPTHIIFSVEATEVVLILLSLSINTMTRYLTKGSNDAEYSNTGIHNKTITNNNNKNNNNDNSSNSNPAFDNEQKLFPLYTTHRLTYGETQQNHIVKQYKHIFHITRMLWHKKYSTEHHHERDSWYSLRSCLLRPYERTTPS